MPIYAYKCSACGHNKDVLQKISDDPLTICPSCGAAAFSKQVTAAGFQLKGGGWYVTDFRSGGDGANSGVGKPAEATHAAAPVAGAGGPSGAEAGSGAAPPSSPSTPSPAAQASSAPLPAMSAAKASPAAPAP